MSYHPDQHPLQPTTNIILGIMLKRTSFPNNQSPKRQNKPTRTS